MVFLMILAESNPRVRISDPWFLNEFSMFFFFFFLTILAESNPRVRISDPWFLNEISMVFFDDFSGVETKGPNFGPLVST